MYGIMVINDVHDCIHVLNASVYLTEGGDQVSGIASLWKLQWRGQIKAFVLLQPTDTEASVGCTGFEAHAVALHGRCMYTPGVLHCRCM